MDAVSYSAARADLAKTMDKVVNDHDPLIITRRSGASVVMISLEDYESMAETVYLLKSPENAKRLLRSIEQAERGNYRAQTLSDD